MSRTEIGCLIGPLSSSSAPDSDMAFVVSSSRGLLFHFSFHFHRFVSLDSTLISMSVPSGLALQLASCTLNCKLFIFLLKKKNYFNLLLASILRDVLTIIKENLINNQYKQQQNNYFHYNKFYTFSIFFIGNLICHKIFIEKKKKTC